LQAKGCYIDTRPIGGKEYHQVYEEYSSSKDETEAPLYNMVMDMEAIEIHKLATEIWSKGGLVHYLNTDECSCSFPRDNKFPFELIENTINLKGYFFDQKGEVPRYKLVEKQESQALKVERMPAHIRHEKYKHKEVQWSVSGDVEDNNVQPLVERILDSGKSCNIDGMAGTGKSTLIKQLKEEMDKRGLKHKSLAPTNKAARIIDGRTIHKFATKTQSTKALDQLQVDYIIVDEISMVPEKFYKFFISMKRVKPNLKFIVVGDFGQFLPVKDRLEGCDYMGSCAPLGTLRRSEAQADDFQERQRQGSLQHHQ
jgi:hypothetical protein